MPIERRALGCRRLTRVMAPSLQPMIDARVRETPTSRPSGDVMLGGLPVAPVAAGKASNLDGLSNGSLVTDSTCVRPDPTPTRGSQTLSRAGGALRVERVENDAAGE